MRRSVQFFCAKNRSSSAIRDHNESNIIRLLQAVTVYRIVRAGFAKREADYCSKASASLRSSSPPAAATRPASTRTTFVAIRRSSAGGVADINHGYSGIVAKPDKVGKDFALVASVERGKRLVEQEQPRPHEQRAADRDTLAFAAGQQARPAIEQGAEIEQGYDAVELVRVAAGGHSSGGRSRDFAAHSDAETAGPPETRSRCRADAAAR